MATRRIGIPGWKMQNVRGKFVQMPITVGEQLAGFLANRGSEFLKQPIEITLEASIPKAIPYGPTKKRSK
jgi:hypothetical protein